MLISQFPGQCLYEQEYVIVLFPQLVPRMEEHNIQMHLFISTESIRGIVLYQSYSGQKNCRNPNSDLTPVREQVYPFNIIPLTVKGTSFRISKASGQTLTCENPFC